MKKGLFLYGVNCTLAIWNGVRDAFRNMDVTYVEYPHEITRSATSITGITKWVYETYGNEPYDFIVGHSMGGLIALELVAVYKVQCDNVLLIESNLRPAKAFYRNLMLPENMVKYGDEMKNMFADEAPFYTDTLKTSLRQGFDFTPSVLAVKSPVFGIYGDRGVENYAGRIADLCLPKDVQEKITFRFVKNACHLPMIENPQGVTDMLMECIQCAGSGHERPTECLT